MSQDSKTKGMYIMKKHILLDLFLTFMKIGLFTFGGGYAMISIIENECVEIKKWITHEEMMNITVIAESTPGPIAINCATFVGYKQRGIWGAIMATVGVVVPSFVIIYIISMFLERFLEITVIANAFRGIQVAVGILIIRVAVNMIKKSKMTLFHKIIFGVALLTMLAVDIFAIDFSSITLIVIAGIVTFTVFKIKEMKGGGVR